MKSENRCVDDILGKQRQFLLMFKNWSYLIYGLIKVNRGCIWDTFVSFRNVSYTSVRLKHYHNSNIYNYMQALQSFLIWFNFSSIIKHMEMKSQEFNKPVGPYNAQFCSVFLFWKPRLEREKKSFLYVLTFKRKDFRFFLPFVAW